MKYEEAWRLTCEKYGIDPDESMGKKVRRFPSPEGENDGS
jgi:hypothetical protein